MTLQFRSIYARRETSPRGPTPYMHLFHCKGTPFLYLLFIDGTRFTYHVLMLILSFTVHQVLFNPKESQHFCRLKFTFDLRIQGVTGGGGGVYRPKKILMKRGSSCFSGATYQIPSFPPPPPPPPS